VKTKNWSGGAMKGRGAGRGSKKGIRGKAVAKKVKRDATQHGLLKFTYLEFKIT
jgi:hypothetical protein